MRVLVRLPAALRGPGDVHPIATDVGGGATVADLLDALATERPTAERRIRDERGELRPHVNVFVADENIRELAGARTVLHEGDEVTVLAAISGG